LLIIYPKDYPLRDPTNEAKYGIDLQQSIVKARKNNRQLFKNHQIYISTAANGHVAVQRIAEINGGETRIVSHTTKPRVKILRSDYLKSVENRVLVCTKDTDDKQLRAKFKEEVEAEGLKCQIYSSEWIMKCVMRQEIVEDNEFAIPV